MTTSPGCFLQQIPDGWRIAALSAPDDSLHDLPCGPDAAPEELAQAVAQFISGRGIRRKSLVIGVDSAAALAGVFAAPPADQRNRRTLTYAFENLLPLSAEKIVADFHASDGRVLGVAIEIEAWLPLVIELEMRGLRVQSISPTALLALQNYLSQVKSEPPDAVVWREGDDIDLFRTGAGAVCGWRHWRSDPQSAWRQLAVESLAQAEVLRCDVLKVEDCDTDLGAGVALRQVAAASRDEHALRAAADILQGNVQAAFELRRDDLAAGDPNRSIRGSLNLLYFAAALLLLAAAAAFWIKSARYQSLAGELRQQEAEAFRQAFPAAAPPEAVLARLRSEHAKLAGARRGKDNVELPVSALYVLHDFLAALADSPRVRFRECRIEDGRFDVEVDLRTHNDANLLVGCFEDRGFIVSPPTTVQQTEETVSSRVFADIRTQSSEAPQP